MRKCENAKCRSFTTIENHSFLDVLTVNADVRWPFDFFNEMRDREFGGRKCIPRSDASSFRVITVRPCRQREHGWNVQRILAIGIGQHAPQVGNNLRAPPGVRTKKHSLMVVIVSMQVVPNDGLSFQYFFPSILIPLS